MQATCSRILALVVAFLVALGCCFAGLRSVLPLPRIPQVSDKLAQFAASGADTVFLGTSKIYSGIVPSLFDEAMAARGISVRSYNFGIDGMGFPESGYLCETIVAANPSRVKTAFIEMAGVRVHVPLAHRGTRRIVYWHDFARTQLVTRAIRARCGVTDARIKDQPAEMQRQHLLIFAERATTRGEGADLLDAALLPAPSPTGRDLIHPEQRGYTPIHGRMRQAEISRFRADMRKPPPRSAEMEEFTQTVRHEFADRLRRSGVRVIYVVSPNPVAQRGATPVSLREGEPLVFAFDHPERYPELYREEFRADHIHLNDAGARVFTEMVAERFAEFVASN